MVAVALTATERRTLALERQWGQLPSPPPVFTSGVSGDYERQLSRLIDKPAAMAYAPITVSYLRRKRAEAHVVFVA